MLRIGTLRWKGRCSRHPRYDPSYDGEGGVTGGCPRCLMLLEIHQQHRRLARLMRDFGPLRDRGIRKETETVSESRLQPSLFD